MLIALILPFIPPFQLVAKAEGDTSYTWIIDHVDSMTATAETATISSVEDLDLSSENTYITVEGDYYEQSHQFNPTIMALFPGNLHSLWSPTSDEIPKDVKLSIMKHNKIAILYDGYLDLDNEGPFKPFGATRIGEILGYDIYARNGCTPTNVKTQDSVAVSGTEDIIQSVSESVTKPWVIINTYRALGIEKKRASVVTFNKNTQWNIVKELFGLSDEDRNDFISKTPLVQYLTGIVANNYTGDENPAAQVYFTRTNPSDYYVLMNKDGIAPMRSHTTDDTSDDITTIDFITYVAEMMETYGEPVLTLQEQYMLLESYGRKLPYELMPRQLDAVQYLLCRGIIDDVTNWDWYTPITFEKAADILMRVKDKDSRYTFKQIQLTTDVSLLSKGYYPIDIGMSDLNIDIFAEPVADKPEDAEYYDYFIRRADDKSLFRSPTSETTVGNLQYEVPGRVVAGKDKWNVTSTDGYYLGRTADGWYHFRAKPVAEVSEDHEHPHEGARFLWLNSGHSDADVPAQYKLPAGGGYYVVNNNAANSNDASGVVSDITQTAFTISDIGKIDATKRTVALTAPEAKTFTGSEQPADDSSNVTSWCITAPAWMFWKDDGSGVDYSKIKGISKEDVFTISDNVTKDSYLSIFVNSDTPISKQEALDSIGIEEALNAARTDMVNGAEGYKATKGYMKSDKYYLLSVDYLRSVGFIKTITEVDDGVYYMNVVSPVQSLATMGMWLNENLHLCFYGSVCIKFPEDRVMITQLGDGLYIDASLIRGNKSSIKVTLPDNDTALLSSFKRADMFGVDNSDSNSLTVLTPGGDKLYKTMVYNLKVDNDDVVGTYLPITAIESFNNFIALWDESRSETPIVTLYTFYELGAKNVNINTDTQLQYRGELASIFGRNPLNDTVYIVKDQSTPVGISLSDIKSGKVSTNDITKYKVLYMKTGEVLLQLRGKGCESPWNENMYGTFMNGPADLPNDLPVVPFYITDWDEGSFGHDAVLVNTNRYSTTDKGNAACRIEVTYGSNYEPNVTLYPTGPDRNVFGEAEDNHIDKLSDIKSLVTPAVTGLPAIYTYGAMPIVLNSPLVRSSMHTYFYYGVDTLGEIPTRYLSEDTEGVLLHSYNLYKTDIDYGDTTVDYFMDGIIISLTAGDFLKEDESIGKGKTKVNWQFGEANALTNWLEWLRQAKLSDAEDIITICIIAVLQWLPRVFMAAFIILMALAMIASVKPWQAFCSKVFDPYKFLTAGRMTVFTVDIRKVVIYSMIALVMFGLFQNGLILQVIGWIARAVAGILNR